MNTDELLNHVRSLRAGQGVTAIRDYLQALYEETKEKIVDAPDEQTALLKAEARLLRQLYDDFGRDPEEMMQQPDGAYT